MRHADRNLKTLENNKSNRNSRSAFSFKILRFNLLPEIFKYQFPIVHIGMRSSTLQAKKELIPKLTLMHFCKPLPNNPSNSEHLEAAERDTKSVYKTLERHHSGSETISTTAGFQLLQLEASPLRKIPNSTTRSKSDSCVTRSSRRPGLHSCEYSPKPTPRHLRIRSIGVQESRTLIKRVGRACTPYCCSWLLIVATILVLFIGALLLTLLLRYAHHFSLVRLQRKKFCFAFDSDGIVRRLIMFYLCLMLCLIEFELYRDFPIWFLRSEKYKCY